MDALQTLKHKGENFIDSVITLPHKFLGPVPARVISLIIAMIVLIVIALLVLSFTGFLAGGFTFMGLSNKQKYGTGNEFIGILQSGQDNPLIAAGDEKEGMLATPMQFPYQNAQSVYGRPTVPPVYDGVDEIGEYKLSQKSGEAGRKFYLVKDDAGRYVLDGADNYVWVTTDDILMRKPPSVILGDIKTDWSDDRTRAAYAAKCKLSGKEDKPDPYAFYLKDGGMTDPNKPFEPFDVKTTSNQAAQIDQQLAKSMLGIA